MISPEIQPKKKKKKEEHESHILELQRMIEVIKDKTLPSIDQRMSNVVS